jgi:hypothetical protein
VTKRYQLRVVDSGYKGPSAPLNLVATPTSSSSITLTWTLVAGASSYTVREFGQIVYQLISGGNVSVVSLSGGTFYTFTVSAVNQFGEGPQSLVASATTPTGSSPTIGSTSPLPGATAGVAYSFTFAASGGTSPYTWSLVSGTIPSGMSLSTGGVLSGTTASPVTDSMVIKVTDSLSASGQSTFSLTVVASGSFSITTASLPAATQYAAYSTTLAATGGATPYTWSITSQTGINAFALSSAGVLTATPNMPLPDSITIQCMDSASRTQSITLPTTVNYVIPAGASALGYTQLQWILLNPNLSNINFSAYGSQSAPNYLYDGYWGNSPVPSPSLYVMVNGILQFQYAAGGTAPQLNSQSAQSIPAAGYLPWLPNANGWYAEAALQININNVANWPSFFLQSTEWNNGPDSTTNPAQPSLGHQFLELDVWEGGHTAGYYGNVDYHQVISGTNTSSNHQNSYTNPSLDQTQWLVAGANWNPSGTANWYLNNVETGTRSILDTGTGPACNATSLAWLNTQHMYVLLLAHAHTTTVPYNMNVGYLAAWGPPTAAASSNPLKFYPATDYAFSYSTSQTSVAQAQTDINLIATQTVTNQGYAFTCQWGSLETAGTNLNNPSNISAQYGGFVTYIQAICNYAWETLGGVPIKIYITGNRYGQSVSASQLTSTNWSTAGSAGGYYIPSDLVNAGGSGSSTLTEPNVYGSTSTTVYSINPIYSGSAYHGLWFWNVAGSTYSVVSPDYCNQGIQSRRAQLFEALAQFSWAMPTSGSTPSSVNGVAFAGQTFTVEGNPLIAGIAIDDEYSYNVSTQLSGTSNNPPADSVAATMFTQHQYFINRVRAAFPTTPFIDCFTYGFTGSSSDTNATMVQHINNNVSPNNGLSKIQGYTFSGADTYAKDFNSSTNYANTAKQGFIGIAAPGAQGAALPTPTLPSCVGQTAVSAQVQPYDYYGGGVSGAGNNASAVQQLMQSPTVLKAHDQVWSIRDYTLNTVWASGSNSGYIASTLLSSRATYPLSTLLPQNYMVAPQNLAVTATSVSSVSLSWSPQTLYTGTGLTYSIVVNQAGSEVFSFTGISISASTYTVSGLNPSTTYTFQIAVQNANGVGPLSAQVSGTTVSAGWNRLLVGSGGYARGMNVVADGTMVCRTDTNGAYLYNGTVWNQLFNVNSISSTLINTTDIATIGAGCFEIQIAPSNTQVFYASYIGYVFKSTNQGTTWTQTAFTQNAAGMNPNDNYGQYGQRMAIDPANPNIVFQGTENNGLYVTTNGGTSWALVSGVPAGSTYGITGILFDPSSSVVGGVTQGIYAASTGNGVYHSTNAGSSWTLTSGGPSNIQYAAIDSSGNYYAVGNSGANLFKYSGTWSTIATPANGASFQAVAINPLNTSEIVVCGTGGQIYISNNAGSTFSAQNLNTSLSTPDIPWLLDANSFGGTPSPYFYLDSGGLAFSPLTNGLLYLSGGTGMWKMNLPAGSGSGTALTWTDFTIAIEQLVANAIVIAPIAGSTPILASWDRPFFNISSLTSYPSTYGPLNSDTIQMGWSLDYASSSPGTIFGLSNWSGEHSGYTTNNGVSWTTFPSAPPGYGSTYIGGTIAASTPTNIVYAIAGQTQPYYTTNGGTSWTGITLPGVSNWSGFQNAYYLKQRSVTADRVTANTFYLYFPGNGVYISTNSGATWTQQKSGYIETNASWATYNSTIMSVPGNAGHLFYTPGPLGGTTPSGGSSVPLYRSTDSGVTWTAVANVTGVNCFNFGAIAPTKSYPSIYIMGFVSGVYGVWQSVDNASTWTNLGNPNSTLQSLQLVGCIAADPNNFGYVYVGFGGAGYAYYTP